MTYFNFFVFTFFCFSGWASQTSYLPTHPIGFDHGLPSGESPGWQGERWFHSELQWGNFWNTEMEMTDARTGDLYTYAVDFEQALLRLETGFALNDQFSISLGLPYAHRFGGILDESIDSYHRFVGADRFRRNEFPSNQERFSIKKNGIEQLNSKSSEGFGPIYGKIKWWFYKPKKEETPEHTGLSVSAQGRSKGFDSGNELSLVFHGGLGLFKKSSVWVNAGVTKMSPFKHLEGWPTRQWAQMYELWTNWNLTEKWDLVLQLRYESPLLNKEHLNFNHISTTPKSMSAERAASGWNGLTAWRGSESLGFVYRPKEGQRWSVFFMEDFGRGDNDGRKNFLYVHGVPDIALISQFQVLY